MLKYSLIIVAALFLGIVSPPYSYGKDYPTKAVEILVPYGPGGSADLGARQLAETSKKYLGQSLVVYNKPGAAGTAVVSELITSKPDGYKMGYLPNNYFAITMKTQRIPFDPSYVIPLINVVEVKNLLAVKSDSPWKTLQELLEYGRKNPGKIRWNHTARGGGVYISTSLMFKRAGVETVDVPYRGAPEQLTALLGGHADVAAFPYATIKEHMRAGDVRILVTFSNERYTDPPNVPCAAELGFPGQVVTQHGVYVHKDTPEDIKRTLFEVFKKSYDTADYKKGIELIGDQPNFGGPEFIKESIQKMRDVQLPVIKELGLYVGGQ